VETGGGVHEGQLPPVKRVEGQQYASSPYFEGKRFGPHPFQFDSTAYAFIHISN